MSLPTYYNLVDFREYYLADLEQYKQQTGNGNLRFYIDLKRHHEEASFALFKMMGSQIEELNSSNIEIERWDENPPEIVLKIRRTTSDLKSIDEIIEILSSEIEREKIYILRGSVPPVVLEDESLSPNQIQKLGLLVRSGIVDFIRDNNPQISNLKIAEFIALIANCKDGKPMKAKSITAHLINDLNNDKHPLYARGKIEEADHILSKYKIKPNQKNAL